SARRQAEEEARLQAETESRRRAEEEARKRAPALEPQVPDDGEEERAARGVVARRGVVKPEVARPAKPTKGEEDRRRGKLTLNAALSGEEARSRSLSAMRRRQE